MSEPRPAVGDACYIAVTELTMAFGERVIQQGINFSVRRGEVFVVMGGSGCGKSTLLRHLLGLQRPAHGEILYAARSLWRSPPAERAAWVALAVVWATYLVARTLDLQLLERATKGLLVPVLLLWAWTALGSAIPRWMVESAAA